MNKQEHATYAAEFLFFLLYSHKIIYLLSFANYNRKTI